MAADVPPGATLARYSRLRSRAHILMRDGSLWSVCGSDHRALTVPVSSEEVESGAVELCGECRLRWEPDEPPGTAEHSPGAVGGGVAAAGGPGVDRDPGAARPGDVRLRCGYACKGPALRGGRVLAWTRQCRREVRVPAGTPGYAVRCWQHPRTARSSR